MFDGRCGYCGYKVPVGYHLIVDHIIPVSRGGSDELCNLMPSCHTCNNFKYSRSVEEFRKKILRQATRARSISHEFVLAERYKLIKRVSISEIKFYFETHSPLC